MHEIVGATMKNKEKKFLPEGYRYLELGEAICSKDYFWNEDIFEWVKIRYDADTSNWIKEHVIRKNNG